MIKSREINFYYGSYSPLTLCADTVIAYNNIGDGSEEAHRSAHNDFMEKCQVLSLAQNAIASKNCTSYKTMNLLETAVNSDIFKGYEVIWLSKKYDQDFTTDNNLDAKYAVNLKGIKAITYDPQALITSITIPFRYDSKYQSSISQMGTLVILSDRIRAFRIESIQDEPRN